MERYTVVWLESADDELVELWMAAENRGAVADAVYEIDRHLAVNPASRGETLSEGMRSLNIPPLRIIFSVREADKLVEVALVRTIPQ